MRTSQRDNLVTDMNLVVGFIKVQPGSQYDREDAGADAEGLSERRRAYSIQ